MSFILGTSRILVSRYNHYTTNYLYNTWSLLSTQDINQENLEILKNVSTIRITEYIYSKTISGDQGNSITDPGGQIVTNYLDHYTIILKLTIFPYPDHWTIYTRWSPNFNHWLGSSDSHWSSWSIDSKFETVNFFFARSLYNLY